MKSSRCYSLQSITAISLCAFALSARAVTFTNDTAIPASDLSYDGADIVVSNCVVTVDGAHTFAGLHISPGGTLTHSNGLPGLSLSITGNVDVASGGAINVSAKGFSSFGLGGGIGDSSGGGGGGYGGYGGNSSSNTPGGAVYGLFTQPIDPGSPGGGFGGAGGGAVRIVADGSITINGAISANGANGITNRSGGGSGGSIWLTAARFAGSGSITADGGAGEPPHGGGGGGGRIALEFGTNGFAGLLAARGGAGATVGGAGTIYTVGTNQTGQVLVDNGGQVGTNTLIQITNSADLVVRGRAAAVFSDRQVLHNLLVASNSMAFINLLPAMTVFGNATIEASGAILSDGSGFPGGAGPGAGGTLVSGGNTTGGGGGNGGLGSPSALGASGGLAYGVLSDPTQAGSGGGSGNGITGNAGGAGGGVIRFTVFGTLRLDGRLSAEGRSGAAPGSGGGAGGSIEFTAQTLSGSGVLSANGGNGNGMGGGGGGGRIAISPTTNLFGGSITAFGGQGGAGAGGAGTILVGVSIGGINRILLTVDNGGKLGAQTTLGTGSLSGFLANLRIINGGVLNWPTASGLALGELLISSNAMMIVTNQTVSLIVVQSNATIQAGGWLLADGAGNFQNGAGTSTNAGTLGLIGSGAGYGGLGGTTIFGTPGGGTYGGVTEPTALGSRGGLGNGSIPASLGGAGGGAFLLNVSRILRVDGKISANGMVGNGLHSGGGSGGSLSLSAGSLVGTGTISANGGAGNGFGGGGAGGRVAVTFTTNLFTGIISAFGAAGGGIAGGAGTVFVIPNNAPGGQFGRLTVDNGGLAGITPYGFSSPFSPDATVSGRSILLLTNSLTFSHLTIRSNSVVVATNNGAFTLTVQSNLTVEAGSVITADGGGFAMGLGQGAGTFTSSSQFGLTGSGAGYGGIGGNSANGPGGQPYGASMSNPNDRGSGGGGNFTAPGGAGGGALRISVDRTLLLNGTISANGRSAVGSNSGGGSGGSLWVTAGTFAGSGSMTVNGGNANGFGGGGAGGRMRVQYSTNLFTGTISAYGGSGYAPGGPGTVYTKANNSSIGQVVLQSNGAPGATGLAASSETYGLTIGSGVTVPVIYSSGASLTLSSLYIASGGTLVFTSGVQIISLPVFGSLTVLSNATIEAGGSLIADGAGSPPGSGLGAAVSSTASGGGYGGVGVRVGTPSGSGAYGLALQPTSLGSGGGPSTGLNALGGRGGGVVNLSVNGLLQLDGRISANGLSGGPAGGTSGPGSAGGGSGGGVLLTTSGIAGSGTIAANGGDGFNAGGGGGGGRIAVYYLSNNFSGSIRAFGGNSGPASIAGAAGAGTIFLRELSSVRIPIGQMLVDNGGRLGTNTIYTDAGLFDLTVQNGGLLTPNITTFRNLLIASNGWLLLTNQIVGATNATIARGGRIIADGSGSQSGLGTGGTSSLSGGGGGHGGYGAASGSAGGGNANDSVFNPSVGGGSGGTSTSSPGAVSGAGGGVVRLIVTNSLILEGIISANGFPGSPNCGGGAGGTVLLTTHQLSGTGLISANGGAGGLPGGGGGGGGRVAVQFRTIGNSLPTNLFTGVLQAFGGASGPTNAVGYGGAGTASMGGVTEFALGSFVLADNGGHSGTNTLLNESASSMNLIVRAGATVAPSISPVFVRTLQLASNGWFVLSNQVLTAQSSVSIDEGGGITAEGRGFPQGQGPGAGASASSSFYGATGGGGGHGGLGAASIAGAIGGFAYDTLIPTNRGSGGGGGVPNSAGAGGGLIRVDAPTLLLNGKISANGNPGLFQHGGGGAGGSIIVSAGILSGAGTISADGGAGNGVGGGGGGGRINISTSTNTFTGPLHSWGGIGGGVGGAGTILYTRRTGQPDNRLLIDNGALFGASTPLGNVTNVGLVIENGAIAGVTAPLVLSNLLVDANGVLTSYPGQSTLKVAVVSNAVIAAGGALALDGAGFIQSAGPGAGQSASGFGSGAGYGGPGGDASTAPGGVTYGSAIQPIDPGSGGGFGTGPLYEASQGGGAIKLDVGGTLTVNGRLTANGNAGIQDNSGGGSGGSIWIDTGILNGTGQISADGGDGESFGGGGGGGGRIAIYRHRNVSPTNTFTGLLSAFGGEGAQWGGDGSIFLSSALDHLQVLTQSPTGVVNSAVSFVDVDFNVPANPYSFSPGDVQLLAPNGLIASNTVTISTLSPTRFRLQFPNQTSIGDYTLSIGPDVENLYGQKMSQVYSGAFTILLPVIQGTVTDSNGLPVAGVVLQPSDLSSPTTTDANGKYALGFVPGAYFIVQASKHGYVFAPSQLTYANPSTSISNQDYVALSTAPNVTTGLEAGQMKMSWHGYLGVRYLVETSTNLVNWQFYSGYYFGNDQNIEISVPVGSVPMRFFRVQANN